MQENAKVEDEGNGYTLTSFGIMTMSPACQPGNYKEAGTPSQEAHPTLRELLHVLTEWAPHSW